METKKCPFCAEEIKKEAIKCKYCGEFLEIEKDSETEMKDGFWICKKCHEDVDDNYDICWNCGATKDGNLDNETATYFDKTVKRDKDPISKSNGLGTAGFIFSLLALLFGWIPVLGWILWFFGLLFSFLGLFKSPRGLAIVGFITSLIDLFILLFFITSIAALFSIPFFSSHLNNSKINTEKSNYDSIAEYQQKENSETQSSVDANYSSTGDDIEQFSLAYIHEIDKDIVDSLECSKQYHNHPGDNSNYTLSSFKKIECDYNNDGISDYFVSYTGENCWGGGGADTYLSNLFFVKGLQEGFEVDEQLSLKFKNKFLQYVKNHFDRTNNSDLSKLHFINGLDYKDIRGNVLNGGFSIYTYGNSYRFTEGSFRYDIVENLLGIKNVKHVE